MGGNTLTGSHGPPAGLTDGAVRGAALGATSRQVGVGSGPPPAAPSLGPGPTAGLQVTACM